MGRFGDMLFGSGDQQRSLDALGRFFAHPQNRFSYRQAHIAEAQGRVAGLLLAFPGRQIGQLEKTLAGPAIEFFGLSGALRLALRSLPLLFVKETATDEFYVAHLAVSPQFHRQGIGQMLMAHAERLAPDCGLRKISLTVDIDNLAAHRLYLKLGYRVVSIRRAPWLRRWLLSTGYQRMVKILE